MFEDIDRNLLFGSDAVGLYFLRKEIRDWATFGEDRRAPTTRRMHAAQDRLPVGRLESCPVTVRLDLPHQSRKGRLDALQREELDGAFDDQLDLRADKPGPRVATSVLGRNVEVRARARNATGRR